MAAKPDDRRMFVSMPEDLQGQLSGHVTQRRGSGRPSKAKHCLEVDKF